MERIVLDDRCLGKHTTRLTRKHLYVADHARLCKVCVQQTVPHRHSTLSPRYLWTKFLPSTCENRARFVAWPPSSHQMRFLEHALNHLRNCTYLCAHWPVIQHLFHLMKYRARFLCRYPAALEMTKHYFQIDELEPRQKKRLQAVFQDIPRPASSSSGGEVRDARGRTISNSGTLDCGKATGDFGRFTPAVVEQVASEYETVDDFISALESRIPAHASYKSSSIDPTP